MGIMVTAIDQHLRDAFLPKLHASTRFFELSKIKLTLKRYRWSHSHEEETVESVPPYDYVNCFKPHAIFIEKLYNFIEVSEPQIACLPVNKYETELHVDGPFRHDNSILNTFSPRKTIKRLFYEIDLENSGQAFFLSLDLSWAIYTSGSLDPQSVVYLLADKKFTKPFFKHWPDIVDFVYRK